MTIQNTPTSQSAALICAIVAQAYMARAYDLGQEMSDEEFRTWNYCEEMVRHFLTDAMVEVGQYDPESVATAYQMVRMLADK